MTSRCWCTVILVLCGLAFVDCAEDGMLMNECGDAVAGPLEQCDDGNKSGGDGCSAECQFEAVCGNGVTESPETCDDGNTADGDGCSAECKLESGILPELDSIQEQIFAPFCVSCHNPQGEAVWSLEDAATSLANLVNVRCVAAGGRKDRVLPGAPDISCLILKLEGSSTVTGDRMPRPPAPPLSSEQIEAIRQWIEDGALP